MLSIQKSSTYLTHNNCAINSELQIGQSFPDCCDHPLHPIEFLAKEDVHRSVGSHLLKTSFHLRKNIDQIIDFVF